ncbi:MAG: thermonuclease family protein [Phycisphaerae bacterium]|nr:thermonuclease family protein [Phycisphaerae bacterium]
MSRRTVLLSGLAVLVLASGAWTWGSDPPAETGSVMGAKNSKVYHTHPEECSHAKRISEENRVYFDSAEDAEKAGRRLCKRCATLDAARGSEGKDGDKVEPGRETKIKEKAGNGTDGTGQIRLNGKRSGGDERGKEVPAREAIAALPEFASVTNVLPGGTLELDIGEKVTLLGVVCPREGQSLAEEAAAFIEERTKGHLVRLERDVAPGPADRRDALGRLLVYVMAEPGGRDLGGELIFQGLGWLDREARSARRQEYARLEEQAWRAARGIWKPLKGAAGKRKVVTGRHAHHYHDPECPHVAHLTGRITLTINEAKARRLPPCRDYRASKHKDDQRDK